MFSTLLLLEESSERKIQVKALIIPQMYARLWSPDPLSMNTASGISNTKYILLLSPNQHSFLQRKLHWIILFFLSQYVWTESKKITFLLRVGFLFYICCGRMSHFGMSIYSFSHIHCVRKGIFPKPFHSQYLKQFNLPFKYCPPLNVPNRYNCFHVCLPIIMCW